MLMDSLKNIAWHGFRAFDPALLFARLVQPAMIYELFTQ